MDDKDAASPVQIPEMAHGQPSAVPKVVIETPPKFVNQATHFSAGKPAPLKKDKKAKKEGSGRDIPHENDAP